MGFLTFIRFFMLLFWVPKVAKEGRNRVMRIQLIVNRLRVSIVLMVGILATGTIGYMLIEDARFFDAYYMSVITLASVGFSEVFPLSDAGRLFTTGLILFSIGLFTYSISTITGIFAEGGFTKTLNEFLMIEKINALNGHAIVCGYGRHATEVAQELSKQGMPFVIIENQPQKLTNLRETSDYLYVDGDATNDQVLRDAGVHRAAAMVVTLPSDSDNLFVVLSARQMNKHLRIISRAMHAQDEIKLRRAGADHVVTPERIGGFYMATLINKPDLVEFFNLLSNMGPSNVVFEEIPVRSLLPKYQEKSIAESRIDVECRIPVVAIRYADGHYELNPPHTEILKIDDHIVVLGNQAQMKKFKEVALGQE